MFGGVSGCDVYQCCSPIFVLVFVFQVVMFIKASRETHSGELALVVRPNGK